MSSDRFAAPETADDQVERPRTIGRRSILGAGALAGVGLLAGCSGDDDPKPAAQTSSSATTTEPTETDDTAVAPAAPDFDPADWDSVRAQFPLDPKVLQFAAFVFAAHPAPVAAAIDKHRKGLDFDTEGYLLKGDFESKVRARAAKFIDVPENQLALTDSATMGLGLLYTGLDLRPGDEILTTTHDFYSTVESLRLAAIRSGAKVNRIKLYVQPASAERDEIIRRLKAGITSKTRIVAVTWVHSGTGVRLPITDMADVIADANKSRSGSDRILFCVDGVHGFGLMNLTMPQLGCDFFVSGTHKWLFGPRGTGILWGNAWERFTPAIPTFSGPGEGQAATPGGYHTFEHRWAASESFDFHDAIGSKQIEDRTIEQATQIKEGLAAVPGVKVMTPMSPDLSAGIVCVTLDDIDPPSAVYELRNTHNITASVTPYATLYLRFGPSIVTNPDEVDAVVDAVSQLTPS